MREYRWIVFYRDSGWGFNLLPISNNYYCCLLCWSLAGRWGYGNLFWNLLPITDKYEATQTGTNERARWYRIGMGLLELYLANRIRRRHNASIARYLFAIGKIPVKIKMIDVLNSSWCWCYTRIFLLVIIIIIFLLIIPRRLFFPYVRNIANVKNLM